MHRTIIFLALTMVLGSLFAGCGGHRRFSVTTDGNGSVTTVMTLPEDGAYDVPTNVWIRVYWPEGSEPPAQFNFDLRNGSDSRVNTFIHEGDQKYEWWFEPKNNLEKGSRYKIEVYDDQDKVGSLFFTVEGEDDAGTASLSVRSGVGPRVSPAQAEHTVRVTP